MQLLSIVAIISCLVSILSAYAVDMWLPERITIIGSFFGLQRSMNEGIAFGLHLGPYQDGIILLAVLIIIIIAFRSAVRITERIGFGLILGGGIANILDRLIDGTVTDMIQVGTFPIFNVADICINIGVALILVEMVLMWLSRQKTQQSK